MQRQYPKQKSIKPDNEICNECGRDVSYKSGLFVDRIVDFDDYKTRKEINKLFPQGDYICRECEEKLRK
ncbi:MAG: hypothetical protein KatS3mg083_372 [Candidatus Dojkabacteria bacterium]|nr:MAG: hypothetical protein KatS3mg083_372 [Candidatus Dojkabacteria bacterium]